MCSTGDAVEMDYGQIWPRIFVDFRFDHLEAGLIIGLITNFREPLNKGTRIMNAPMHKRKKKKDTSDLQAIHPW